MRFPTLCAAMLMLAAARADAAPAAAPSRMLAASCSGCHGTHGQGGGAMPALAGLPADHLGALLRAFRDGARPSSVMHQLARGYTDEEIAALAAHFAGLPRPAHGAGVRP